MTTTRWRLRDGVLIQAALSRAVLLDARGGDYFELNETGSVALRALLANDDAAAALVAEFAVDDTTARADVQALIATLLARGLLVPRDA